MELLAVWSERVRPVVEFANMAVAAAATAAVTTVVTAAVTAAVTAEVM
jgi:hypothetical protein